MCDRAGWPARATGHTTWTRWATLGRGTCKRKKGTHAIQPARVAARLLEHRAPDAGPSAATALLLLLVLLGRLLLRLFRVLLTTEGVGVALVIPRGVTDAVAEDLDVQGGQHLCARQALVAAG